MNITKKKQTHRYREQVSSYLRGEGSREGQYKRHKPSCTKQATRTSIQHRERSQNFIITTNGILTFKTVEHYTVCLQLTQYCTSTIRQVKKKKTTSIIHFLGGTLHSLKL